jgi:hypothetical protein
MFESYCTTTSRLPQCSRSSRVLGSVTFRGGPLVVPVLIAAVVAWPAWRGHLLLGLAGFLLAGFTLISGFSIGGAYLPASGLLILASGLAVSWVVAIRQAGRSDAALVSNPTLVVLLV